MTQVFGVSISLYNWNLFAIILFNDKWIWSNMFLNVEKIDQNVDQVANSQTKKPEFLRISLTNLIILEVKSNK